MQKWIQDCHQKNTLVRTSDLNQYIPIWRINEFVRNFDFDETGAFSKYLLKTEASGTYL